MWKIAKTVLLFTKLSWKESFVNNNTALFCKVSGVSGDLRTKLSLCRSWKLLIKKIKAAVPVGFHKKNNCEHVKKAINQVNRMIKLLQFFFTEQYSKLFVK